MPKYKIDEVYKPLKVYQQDNKTAVNKDHKYIEPVSDKEATAVPVVASVIRKSGESSKLSKKSKKTEKIEAPKPGTPSSPNFRDKLQIANN